MELCGAVLGNHALCRWQHGASCGQDIFVFATGLPHACRVMGCAGWRCGHDKIVTTLKPHGVSASCAVFIAAAVDDSEVIRVAYESPVQSFQAVVPSTDFSVPARLVVAQCSAIVADNILLVFFATAVNIQLVIIEPVVIANHYVKPLQF